MIVLTYGHKKPEAGIDESMTSWMPALEDNIVIDDAHDHDGLNSKRISALALTKSTLTISKTNPAWADTGNGVYKLLVSMPVGFEVQSSIMQFFENNAGVWTQIFPEIEQFSDSSFNIYTNDLTYDIKVLVI